MTDEQINEIFHTARTAFLTSRTALHDLDAAHTPDGDADADADVVNEANRIALRAVVTTTEITALHTAAEAAFKDKSIQGLARVTVGNWLRARTAALSQARR